MPIAFQCEHCGRNTRVADELSGRKIRCPGCREVIVVPEEVLDVEVEELPPERPVRRSRRPFEEESKRRASPPPSRSLTLDNTTQASNPGRVSVNPLKYWASYPMWPTIWFGSTLFFGLIGLLFPGMLIGATVCGVLMFLYWTRVREHFRCGCALPAIVISVDKQLVAVLTDLTTGDGSYPAVKILKQPLSKMTGGPARKNQRLVAVALYEPSPTQTKHWATFHPKVVNCVTNDEVAIRQTLETIDDSDFDELIGYLEQIPKKTVGLHKMW